MKSFVLSILCATFFVVNVTSATAVDATSDAGKAVMTAIADVRKVVNEKKGKVSDAELDKALEDVIFPVFDFAEMSKQCLGANWNKATPAEQKEFTDLFSDLLAHTYLSKVRKVDQTTIDLTGENVEPDRGVIKTNLVDKGDDVAINYRVYKNGARWLVYDIIIENISLASNYRSEFAAIVRKDEVAGLIKKLREKKDTRETNRDRAENKGA